MAQKITKPQAVVSFLCTLLHLLINWLFVSAFGWGPAAVAWANSLANLNMLLGMAAYVVLYGKGYCVWGRGVSLQALRVSLMLQTMAPEVVAAWSAMLSAYLSFCIQCPPMEVLFNISCNLQLHF